MQHRAPLDSCLHPWKGCCVGGHGQVSDLLCCTSKAEYETKGTDFASPATYLSFCWPPAGCKASYRQSSSSSQHIKQTTLFGAGSVKTVPGHKTGMKSDIGISDHWDLAVNRACIHLQCFTLQYLLSDNAFNPQSQDGNALSCPSRPRSGENPRIREREKLPQPNLTGSFESQKRNCRRIQRGLSAMDFMWKAPRPPSRSRFLAECVQLQDHAFGRLGLKR